MIKFANLLLAIEANRYRLRSLNGSSKYDILRKQSSLFIYCGCVHCPLARSQLFGASGATDGVIIYNKWRQV